MKKLRLTKPSQFSHSVVSDSLWPHGLQHSRLPCPSPAPEACSNSCPSSWWCHPTISSSVISFSCLQSFPASGSFPMSWLFASGSQKYWNFSFSINPSSEYSGLISLRIDWFDLLAVQGSLKSFLHSSKASVLWCSAFIMVQLSHPYMTTGKTIPLTMQNFVYKLISLLSKSVLPSKQHSAWMQILVEWLSNISKLTLMGWWVRGVSVSSSKIHALRICSMIALWCQVLNAHIPVSETWW